MVLCAFSICCKGGREVCSKTFRRQSRPTDADFGTLRDFLCNHARKQRISNVAGEPPIRSNRRGELYVDVDSEDDPDFESDVETPSPSSPGVARET
jgi:hypothetical protein